MEFSSPLYCLLLILLGLVSYSHAYVFYVGGRSGWVLNPSEGYNHWAERNRFLINDTIVFKYKKGSDSVLVVNKDDYDKCNTKNPIKKFEDGNSIFKFDRSGPFYFIGGDGNCEKGQKLIVVVLSARSSPVSPSPTPSSPPPKSPSPSPAPSSPPPKSPSPAPAIAPAPAKPSPTPSPSATSPSPATEPPQASPPSPPANTPAPVTSPSPSSTTPGSPETPSQSPSQNENAPAPSPNGAMVVGPPSFLVYSVTIVIGVAVSGILGAF